MKDRKQLPTRERLRELFHYDTGSGEAHRLVWAWHNEVVPDHLDHVDRDPSNNRVENLRPCTHAENCQNRGKRRGRTSSPYKGVSWINAHGRWRASLSVRGRLRHLGYFDNPEDAAQAYNFAAHTEFGPFALLNNHTANIEPTK